VKSNLLSADEVLARRYVLRDGKRDGGVAGRGERKLAIASFASRGLLVDFEPGLALASIDRVGLGGLGHVDIDGAGMVDGSVGLDGDAGASRDSGSLGLAGGRIVVELVAADSLVLDVGHRAISETRLVQGRSDMSGSLTSSG
jgi:hypothetical protein